EGSHRTVAGPSQFGQQITIGPRRIGESMQAERQWSLAHLPVVKPQSIRLDNSFLEFWHGVFPLFWYYFLSPTCLSTITPRPGALRPLANLSNGLGFDGCGIEY